MSIHVWGARVWCVVYTHKLSIHWPRISTLIYCVLVWRCAVIFARTWSNKTTTTANSRIFIYTHSIHHHMQSEWSSRTATIYVYMHIYEASFCNTHTHVTLNPHIITACVRLCTPNQTIIIIMPTWFHLFIISICICVRTHTHMYIYRK